MKACRSSLLHRDGSWWSSAATMASTWLIAIVDCGERSRLTASSIVVGILFDKTLIRELGIAERLQTLLSRQSAGNGAKSGLSRAKLKVPHPTLLLPVIGCRRLTSSQAGV